MRIARIAIMGLVAAAFGIAAARVPDIVRRRIGRAHPPHVSRTLLSRVQPTDPQDSLVVRVVLFCNFQCAFCREADERLEDLRKENPRVLVDYRHFLEFGDLKVGEAAAEAYECAAEFGTSDAVRHALWSYQTVLRFAPWERVGARAAVRDRRGFEACIRARRFAARIEEDQEIADSLHVVSTPTLLVGPHLWHGVPSLDELRWLVGLTRREASGR